MADHRSQILYPVWLLAVVGAGGIFTGTNPAYTPHELTRHVRTTRARFLVVEPELLSTVTACITDTGMPSSSIFVLNATKETFASEYPSWKRLMTFGEADWVRLASHDEAKSTTAALLSTSGTSGLPKAAMISHHILISEACMIDDVKQKPYEVNTHTTTLLNKLTSLGLPPRCSSNFPCIRFPSRACLTFTPWYTDLHHAAI